MLNYEPLAIWTVDLNSSNTKHSCQGIREKGEVDLKESWDFHVLKVRGLFRPVNGIDFTNQEEWQCLWERLKHSS